MEERETKQVLIGKDLHGRFKVACAKEDRSIREVTEELVLRWVEKQEKKSKR